MTLYYIYFNVSKNIDDISERSKIHNYETMMIIFIMKPYTRQQDMILIQLELYYSKLQIATSIFKLGYLFNLPYTIQQLPLNTLRITVSKLLKHKACYKINVFLINIVSASEMHI